jgi:hypothetical protein
MLEKYLSSIFLKKRMYDIKLKKRKNIETLMWVN